MECCDKLPTARNPVLGRGEKVCWQDHSCGAKCRSVSIVRSTGRILMRYVLFQELGDLFAVGDCGSHTHIAQTNR